MIFYDSDFWHRKRKTFRKRNHLAPLSRDVKDTVVFFLKIDPQGDNHLVMSVSVCMWPSGEVAFHSTSNREKQANMWGHWALTITSQACYWHPLFPLMCLFLYGGQLVEAREGKRACPDVLTPSGRLHVLVWQPRFYPPTVWSSGNAWEVF